MNGHRTLTLLNPNWTKPHHVVELERMMGALQIPIGTYHRSITGGEGSTVLNQWIRADDFAFHNEFNPVSLRDHPELQAILETPPCIWRWRNGHIQRRFRMKTWNSQSLNSTSSLKDRTSFICEQKNNCAIETNQNNGQWSSTYLNAIKELHQTINNRTCGMARSKNP